MTKAPARLSSYAEFSTIPRDPGYSARHRLGIDVAPHILPQQTGSNRPHRIGSNPCSLSPCNSQRRSIVLARPVALPHPILVRLPVGHVDELGWPAPVAIQMAVALHAGARGEFEQRSDCLNASRASSKRCERSSHAIARRAELGRPLFVLFLLAVIVVMTLLQYLPILALGPTAVHFFAAQGQAFLRLEASRVLANVARRDFCVLASKFIESVCPRQRWPSRTLMRPRRNMAPECRIEG